MKSAEEKIDAIGMIPSDKDSVPIVFTRCDDDPAVVEAVGSKRSFNKIIILKELSRPIEDWQGVDLFSLIDIKRKCNQTNNNYYD